MLEYLHISNLALIEDMELEFSDGINVLTGETGAGKSFILKALGFLLGDKLSPDIVRPGADRAKVEATFVLNGEDLILRRELMSGTGRSRFYVNDTLKSQETLRDYRAKLISHTSQHAQQQLLQPAYQARLLEKDIKQPELAAARDDLLQKLKNIAGEIKTIVDKQSSLAEKRELLELQKNEIEKIAPKEGEEEKLDALRTMAKSNVAAKQNYNKAISLLHGDDNPGLIQLLQDFERLLKRMCVDTPSLAQDSETVASFRAQLQHISNTLPRPQATEKMDMDAIEERLFAFAQLKRKLKRSMPEIFALQKEIEENLSFLDVCALDISRLNKEKGKLEAGLKEAVEKIKPLRHEAAENFAQKLAGELRDLGFSEHVAVIPRYIEQEIWPGIAEEKGVIDWAPNPGQNPQPLDKIASGGELSRFLLAINTIDIQDGNITYIFDEVDAGVGGITLNKVADKLTDLSERNQVILITHWPQLAAKAKRHFNIVKMVENNQTYTRCAPLNHEQRKAELARMAGGGKEGEALASTLFD